MYGSCIIDIYTWNIYDLNSQCHPINVIKNLKELKIGKSRG